MEVTTLDFVPITEFGCKVRQGVAVERQSVLHSRLMIFTKSDRSSREDDKDGRCLQLPVLPSLKLILCSAPRNSICEVCCLYFCI